MTIDWDDTPYHGFKGGQDIKYDADTKQISGYITIGRVSDIPGTPGYDEPCMHLEGHWLNDIGMGAGTWLRVDLGHRSFLLTPVKASEVPELDADGVSKDGVPYLQVGSYTLPSRADRMRRPNS
ncbi:hypothetical protein [Stenotrophomonas sp.]|uniref:hypothetical protein n=1 Tax=Stenotrophomonas sp. TaxID=69392 RepID=UPI00289CDA6E|nr:hypothetical protein [Stenotrophomonas sp.]